MREEDGGAHQSQHSTSLLMTKNVDRIIDHLNISVGRNNLQKQCEQNT